MIRAWACVLALAILLAAPVLAHNGQNAGTVQVDVGIDAVSRKPLALMFRFDLHKDVLPLTACRCRVLVYKGKPTARTAPLQDMRLGALQNGKANVVLKGFPAGSYTLVLDGRPPKFGDFNAFRSNYNYDVPDLGP